MVEGLKEEKIRKHMENLEEKLEGQFTFGKKANIQKHIGCKPRGRLG